MLAAKTRNNWVNRVEEDYAMKFIEDRLRILWIQLSK